MIRWFGISALLLIAACANSAPPRYNPSELGERELSKITGFADAWWRGNVPTAWINQVYSLDGELLVGRVGAFQSQFSEVLLEPGKYRLNALCDDLHTKSNPQIVVDLAPSKSYVLICTDVRKDAKGLGRILGDTYIWGNGLILVDADGFQRDEYIESLRDDRSGSMEESGDDA